MRKRAVSDRQMNGQDVWEEITALFFTFVDDLTRKYTLDELVHKYSDACDAVILEGMNRERLAYIGGKLYLSMTDQEDRFIVGMEAYFQKNNGEWVVKSNKTRELPVQIQILDSRSELKKKRRIEYELTKPELKDRGLID